MARNHCAPKAGTPGQPLTTGVRQFQGAGAAAASVVLAGRAWAAQEAGEVAGAREAAVELAAPLASGAPTVAVVSLAAQALALVSSAAGAQVPEAARG